MTAAALYAISNIALVAGVLWYMAYLERKWVEKNLQDVSPDSTRSDHD